MLVCCSCYYEKAKIGVIAHTVGDGRGSVCKVVRHRLNRYNC